MYVLFRVYNTGLTSSELNNRLIKAHKVTMVPASDFYPEGALLEGVALLRVNVTLADEESIEKVFRK